MNIFNRFSDPILALFIFQANSKQCVDLQERDDCFYLKKEVFASIREWRLSRLIFIIWNILKRRIFYTANFAKRKSLFWFAVFLNIILRNIIITTSYLVILVQKGIRIFVFARSQDNEMVIAHLFWVGILR